MTTKAKILLVGPVNGQLRHLSAKLSALQKSKAGPFDVCLCAGKFFGDDDDGSSKAELEDLAEGEIELALPVLFVDPSGAPELSEADDAGGIDGLKRLYSNLYQLVGDGDGAPADIVSVPLPLDGADDEPPRTRLAVGFLRPNVRLPCPSFEGKAKHPSFLGCDVLISSEWGQGVVDALPPSERERAIDAGTYDVAELAARGGARYHLAPGLPAPAPSDGDPAEARRFVASLPYAHPGRHAGRFLALGGVASPARAKELGKACKFVHALGITPLAYMNSAEREAAREESAAVKCPYTDESYKVDDSANGNGFAGGQRAATTNPGGMSEAQARRIAQEDAAATMSSSNAFRWQHDRSRKRGRDDDPRRKDEEAGQSFERNNPSNLSLFLHGLHRDPGGVLTESVLADAFRPFGCVAVRFPRARPAGQSVSFVFLDFGSHEEAERCLDRLKGEVVIRNIMLTLKWSSTNPNRTHPHNLDPTAGTIPPPPPKRRNRLTEAEAADSVTLFLRLPPALESSSFLRELETLRLLAQRAMEDELNAGVDPRSEDRITSADEPALRVTARRPDAEKNYGFLGFDSHAAALTALVSLTGNEDGGLIGAEKLRIDVNDGKNASHLEGVTLYWAKGGQPKSTDGNGKPGYNLQQRTDCWFCLASPTCEKHLIVAVFDECYVAMPKGAVDDFHALIVPVEHKQQGALIDRQLTDEINDIKAKLRRHAHDILQKDLFVFERCIQTKGGYHTHVQCIPVDSGSGPSIQSKMTEMAVRSGFRLREITSDLGLAALGDDWSHGYFYAEIPLAGGREFRRFIYRAGGEGEDTNNVHVPLQFGREVLAAVTGNPDMGQWKACVVSQEKEEELALAFRKSLGSV